MVNKRPNIYAHCSYIGTTGYNNHTRNFFRALADYFKIKVRNFTVGSTWDGLNDTPHDKEGYINDLDKKLLAEQSLYENREKEELSDHSIYTEFKSNFVHDINIVLSETNHPYFYQNYTGPRIAYNVWETTRQPDHFFDVIKNYDQIWVPSKWQKKCTEEQGIPASNIKIVPEAVDENVFKPDSNATLPEYDDGRFKFVVFGRWDYRKATKEIIESFLKEFNKKEPVDLILSIDNTFAADGFSSTEERLQHYNLIDPRLKIKHFPTREEYVKYLQKGHVFVSCARSEGWNLPLLEAMACGTPSIYSNCSGQLEFAEGKGLPVKIKKQIPAKFGEYNSFSQHIMAGEFYEPDFNDLRKVMRDAYTNYDTYKKRALQESELIREQFTWDNAAQIAGHEIIKLYNNLPANRTEISFEQGPKVEVIGHHKKEYFVEFIDARNNQILHSDTITNNMWTKCSKEYYIPWIIKINGEVAHTFDLTDKKVKIAFDSKSVGDTVAWMPQVLEFKNKYKCNVAVSTFHNEWFENLEVYKNLEFVEPDTDYPAYAHYKIGWFKTDGKWDEGNKNPKQANTVPLIQAATDILGLPYKEINHGIDFNPGERPIKQKYICIGPRSTAGLKEWPYQNWKELARLLHKDGYKVVNLSYEGFEGPHILNKKGMGWEKTWNYLYHADLFIGLGSGLSWMNWALGKHTLMINNFIPFGFEFTKNLTKLENHSVCNNCWIKKEFNFDPGDWDWCPVNRGTGKQHICQKSITVDKAYKKSVEILSGKHKVQQGGSGGKDLICITAHCPTPFKRKVLLDLVTGLQPIRKDFDIMVVSHTPISSDVQEKVDWAIYDQDNEILKEWKYQNSPWFKPSEDTIIQSIFFGIGNTYLPVHKQLITGYSLAKTFGYNKIHITEYDAYYSDFTEFYENSKYLEEYDAVLYKKADGYGEVNLEWGMGCFHSAKITSLDDRAFYYTSETIKKELEEQTIRTTEKRTEDIYTANGNKVLFKDFNVLETGGNKIRLVNFHAQDFDMQWAVPIYNTDTKLIDFIAWNESSDKPCNITIVVNNKNTFYIKNLKKFSWELITLGNPQEVKDIVILINNQQKHHIQLNEENIEKFKLYNFLKKK